jgi:hypothetical protein
LLPIIANLSSGKEALQGRPVPVGDQPAQVSVIGRSKGPLQVQTHRALQPVRHTHLQQVLAAQRDYPARRTFCVLLLALGALRLVALPGGAHIHHLVNLHNQCKQLL